MSDSATEPTLSMGAQFAGYGVLEVLERHDFGTLYLAQGTVGQVFLRVVEPHVLEQSEVLDRIEADLAKLEGVVHRNVAKVLVGGEEEDGFYYALEALAATSLHALTERCRPLYEREVVWLGRGLTAGLAAIHAADIYHGGLSPKTVVVSHHGPILVDLGWDGRLGSTEPDLAEAKKLDLQALRDVLYQAVNPPPADDMESIGGTPPMSPKVSALLEGLVTASSAVEIADDWKDAAASLGLPDPMAPDSLRILLERYEGSAPPPSDEGSVEGSSDELEGSSETAAPLEPGEGPDEDSDEVSAPYSAADLMGAADEGESYGDEEKPPRETVQYAKGVLDGYPVEAPSAVAPRPSGLDAPPDEDSTDESIGDSGEFTPLVDAPDDPTGRASKRSDTGKAPPLGKFGRYELLGEISAGRTSTVFMASEDAVDRPRAVKVMLPGLLDGETTRTRFLRDAEAAESLAHPAIARTLESGVEDGWVYVASEYVQGRKVTEIAKETSPLAAKLPHAMLDVLRALDYAHSRGIVHGELKPDNILVMPDGRTKVVEFGLSRVRAKEADFPPSTPYTAPELSEGGKDELGDVYAAGVTLFEVATRGKLPASAGLGSKLALGKRLAPSAFKSDIPWQIDSICLSSIVADPAGRYPSAGKMADDLQRCLLGPVEDQRGSISYRARLWVLKKPIGALSLVAGVVVASLLVVLAVGQMKKWHWGAAADVLIGRVTSTDGGDDGRDNGGDDPFAGDDGTPTPVPLELPTGGETGADPAELESLRERNGWLETELSEIKEDRARIDEQRSRFEDELDALRLERDELESNLERARSEADSGGDPSRPTLDAGKVRREAEARAREAREQEASESLKRGRDLLAREQYQDARVALSRALGLGADEAEDLLSEVDEALLDSKLDGARAERQDEDRAQAKKLVRQARSYATRKAYDQAWDAYVTALSLDPKSSSARAGLKELEASRSSGGPAPVSGDRLAESQQALRTAGKAYLEGRTLFQQGADPDAVTDAYFSALRNLERSLVLTPGNASAKSEQEKVGLELVSILKEYGQAGLSRFVLDYTGIEASKVVPVKLPRDPYLVIEEAERTSIQRAFGGSVRFESTKAFTKLRGWIKANGQGRFRIVLQIKSVIVPGFPPTVNASGIWIALEDTKANTRKPPKRITFSGGPYKRVVRVDARGRIILPFDKARPFDARPYIREAAKIARDWIEEAKGTKRDD